MNRFLFAISLICTVFSCRSFACECIDQARACEYLAADIAFTGRVLETVAVKHPTDKAEAWTAGYSMRFDVEEPLRGTSSGQVTIETGSGGGDCGTPLAPGERFLIFAYRDKNGQLWTGACSGNQVLNRSSDITDILPEIRALSRKSSGSIFGRVTQSKPFWREDEVVDSDHPHAVKGLVMYAKSASYTSSTRTAKDGSYEFSELPNDDYIITPELKRDLDFDHDNDAERRVGNGSCSQVNFLLKPTTRIRGHVSVGSDAQPEKLLTVEAIPVSLKDLNQFSGVWDITDENGSFDLWPLPAGDYLVGVNINSSPKPAAPFPPTYYPGVTNREAAKIVHLNPGEIRELEMPLLQRAQPREVHLVAIGPDGKPLKTVYIQREDLRHPGDASSYENVELDEGGAGAMTIYEGFSYHLHASHWVSWRSEWCAPPAVVPAGTGPVDITLVLSIMSDSCDITAIDSKQKKK